MHVEKQFLLFLLQTRECLIITINEAGTVRSLIAQWLVLFVKPFMETHRVHFLTVCIELRLLRKCEYNSPFRWRLEHLLSVIVGNYKFWMLIVVILLRWDASRYTSNITRAQRGLDRSPEYNKHFFYKLDFLAYQIVWLLYSCNQSIK